MRKYNMSISPVFIRGWINIVSTRWAIQNLLQNQIRTISTPILVLQKSTSHRHRDSCMVYYQYVSEESWCSRCAVRVLKTWSMQNASAHAKREPSPGPGVHQRFRQRFTKVWQCFHTYYILSVTSVVLYSNKYNKKYNNITFFLLQVITSRKYMKYITSRNQQNTIESRGKVVYSRNTLTPS